MCAEPEEEFEKRKEVMNISGIPGIPGKLTITAVAPDEAEIKIGDKTITLLYECCAPRAYLDKEITGILEKAVEITVVFPNGEQAISLVERREGSLAIIGQNTRMPISISQDNFICLPDGVWNKLFPPE